MTNGSRLISLSAYDQSLVVAPALVGLLYYGYVPDVDRLGFSLGKALERFPRFATRIVRTTRGSFAAAPLQRPPALELRSAVSWTPDLFSTDQLSVFVNNLETVPGPPVLTATLTPVSRGAVLGISLSHTVADGYSLYLFLSHWAEQFAAAAHASKLGRQNPVGLPRSSADDAEISSVQELDAASRDKLERLRGMKRFFSVLSFDRTFLESLRAELATKQFAPTINEALTAFLVHRYGRNIMGGAAGLRLRVPVDVRGIHPAMHSDFIGNAFLEAIVPLDELIDSTSAARQTAQRIHETVEKVRDRKHVESTLHVRHDRVEFDAKDFPVFDRQTDIVSTSIAKMPVHKLDFGNGPPSRYFCMLAAPAGFVIASASIGLEAQIFSEHGVISGSP